MADIFSAVGMKLTVYKIVNMFPTTVVKQRVAQVTRKEWERVKFKAMVEGEKVCFLGNQWLEGKFLLTGSYYF